MNNAVTGESDLINFMNCEQLDENLFRGQSKDLNTGQVYGGQVLGQAIKAAQHTVGTDRQIRSAHAYFLLKGDVNAPIIYEVDRSLDGGSISSRRVVAIQHGRQIFHLSASFQKDEAGLEYQPKIDVPVASLEASIAEQEPSVSHFQAGYLDVYYVDPPVGDDPNSIQLWIKTKERLPDDHETHNSVLAYISDMGLLHATTVPHNLQNSVKHTEKKVIMASIDHAIWYHRPFRVDEWFFYDCKAISTGNGRGLSSGRLYARDGTFFANTIQQGMLRIPRDKQ